nr:hypothetical protein [Acidobacteriota bacterium]
RRAGLGSVPGLDGSMWGLVVSADGAHLYGGVTRSAGGASVLSEIYERTLGQSAWRLAGPPLPFEATLLAQDPANPAGLLAGTAGGGLLRSLDGGTTWKASSQGMEGARIVDLTADPSRPARFYAIDSLATLWRSTDSGATWTALAGNIGGPLTVDPHRPNTLYSRGPSRSDDGGLHWRSLRSSHSRGPDLFHCQEWFKQAVDPLADATIYLIMLGSNSIGCHSPGVFLYKSSDGGRHWAVLNPPSQFIYDLGVAAGPATVARPARSLVYLLDSDAVVRSRDGGATWTRQALGLAPGGQTSSMAVSADGRLLYVYSSEGVLRSQDGATTWQRLPPAPLQDSTSLTLVIDPLASSTLYGYAKDRFFRSQGGGASWTEFSAGLRWAILNGPLAFDRLHPGRILAASLNSGVIEIDLPPAPRP